MTTPEEPRSSRRTTPSTVNAVTATTTTTARQWSISFAAHTPTRMMTPASPKIPARSRKPAGAWVATVTMNVFHRG